MATPDLLTEEQRAADYRVACVARMAFLQARALALAPTLGADAAVAWAPLLATLGDQSSVCDSLPGDSAQLGQLT